MKSFWILFSLFLVSCQEVPVEPTPNPVPTIVPAPTPSPIPPTPTPSPIPKDHSYRGPAELQPYINTFVNLGAIQGVKVDVSEITLQFGDLSEYGSGVIGLCEMGYRQPLVTLNETWWSKADLIQRTLLVVHELGHCDLKRPHRNDTQGKRPLSIMYPIIISNSTYLGFKDEYDHELYTYGNELNADEPTVYVCDVNELG